MSYTVESVGWNTADCWIALPNISITVRQILISTEKAAYKVKRYEPRTNKIKSKFNNKANYVCNKPFRIVIERFEGGVTCHREVSKTIFSRRKPF